ncbi:hypothetical protein BOTBODRAFT_57542 [Botryobasidium botryosum FD-172 SS1]|uniref:3'(2'),5'-bisphosphate nucleotidase n=1 Tax=Botryobasidium botryosum (strain FD-172 SS1) TaxID=930990 RepID=A0A067M934_BOTB1|nr:hypothetical protein BOTBODRAFT_57542 [Botryobasidium botryosum FD-172 SS1]
MSAAFALEKQVAVSAVLRACQLTSAVFKNLVTKETVTKKDKSPVTVADYAAQAVINTIITAAFPKDPIVGEEDASDLRSPTSDDAALLRERVTTLANDVLTPPPSEEERAEWGLGFGRTTTELLAAIDRGNYAGGRTGRMWALDPIDGTKGFLRGGQYAVCLALLVDSVVQVGVMGCPNLPVDPSNPSGETGCLFVAVRGQGAQQRPFSSFQSTTLRIPPSPSLSDVQFLESVEAAHSSHGFNARVASTLGVTAQPNRMDSQAKYCSLSRGAGNVYLRMPTGQGYREKIWDHASGSLLVEEAGGIVSDSLGRPLDFGLGRTLGENFGVVAAGKDIHSKIIEAIQAVKAEESEKLTSGL